MQIVLIQFMFVLAESVLLNRELGYRKQRDFEQGAAEMLTKLSFPPDMEHLHPDDVSEPGSHTPHSLDATQFTVCVLGLCWRGF